jgi:hypothetical protein
MASKFKTIAGKVLRTVAKVGVGVASLYTGGAAGAAVAAAGKIMKVGALAKGTGLLAKVGKGLGKLFTKHDQVKQSAQNLVNKVTTVVRAEANATKDEIRRDVNTIAENESGGELVSTPVGFMAKNQKMLLYGGIAAVALLFILKGRRR